MPFNVREERAREQYFKDAKKCDDLLRNKYIDTKGHRCCYAKATRKYHANRGDIETAKKYEAIVKKECTPTPPPPKPPIPNGGGKTCIITILVTVILGIIPFVLVV